jgi:phosphate transport system substrate-binding protein
LFLYVKKAHLSAIPNLKAFLNAYTQAWAPNGPLVRRGLISAPADVRARSAAIVQRQTLLDPKTLS